MNGLTLFIAISGVILVLSLRPVHGLAAYVAVLLAYPSYMVVSLGTIDISAGRIVISFLLARCLFTPSIKNKFKWCKVDSWVTANICVAVFVIFITSPFSQALENRAGFVMDTYFVYLAVRLCVTSHAELIKFTKIISVLLIPIAILGILESTIGWRPYEVMRSYCPWRSESTLKEGRMGFERAEGPFGQAVMFGTLFLLFLPCIWALRHERNYWGKLACPLSCVAILGVMSSMSSGPWAAMVFTILCLVMERFKRCVKPLLLTLLALCIFVGVVSNRPFYHVLISWSNPLGGSGWHRARIIDAAIENINEWWFIGYKGEDPGWGKYTGMSHSDITNEFAIAGVRYGILGVITLCGVLYASVKQFVRLHNCSNNPQLQSWAWALGTVIASLIVTFLSVSIFGQMLSIFYLIIGLAGASVNLVPLKKNLSMY